MNKIQKGFTIIELIVVIAIIAILAAIVLVNVTQYIAKAKTSAVQANLSTIETSMAAYLADPANTTATGADINAVPSTALANNCNSGSPTAVSILAAYASSALTCKGDSGTQWCAYAVTPSVTILGCHCWLLVPSATGSTPPGVYPPKRSPGCSPSPWPPFGWASVPAVV